jgi:FdhD protein
VKDPTARERRGGALTIGVSSCLLGERVRYNGDHKRAAWLEALDARVDWVPVCPEVETGMGVPREPVRLVADGGIRMRTVNSGIDYTESMESYAGERIEALVKAGICGYILKKDSPSCGLTSVNLFEGDTVVRSDARGLYAQVLVARMPGLPVVEEDALSDAEARDAFLSRCERYRSAARPLSPLRHVRVTRVNGGGAIDGSDVAATEEPLEVRLHGRPFAVLMRTPGQDRELAAGFLFSEGVIRSAGDVGAVEHCRHPDHPDVHNVVDAWLLGDAAAAVDAHLDARRRVLTTSACGLCGRTTIESLRVRAATLQPAVLFATDAVASLPDRLRAYQGVFDETGGLHAAALFTADGGCEVAAEDVGRHNAVDKAIGAMLLADRLPLPGCALVVSGRASYEIVQKAWLAGVGLVCAVSAPSSLAIDLAHEAGITLLGFVREGAFNIYAHPERILRPGRG